MNFDYLFVLTYGRSGSTLLQGVLNAIDGVEVRGENGATLRGLFNSVKCLVDAKARYESLDGGPESPWYGISSVDVERYIDTLREAFVRNVLAPRDATRVLGFKEIRYYGVDLEVELAMFRRFFKKSAFVVNTRNLEDAIESNVRAGHTAAPDQIREADRALRVLADGRHPDVFHVHYDDYKDNPGNLAPLFDFLGARFDESTIQSILKRTHSTITGSKQAALGGG